MGRTYLKSSSKANIGRQQDGIFKKDSDTLAIFDTDLKLFTLKPAEKGNGIIGRFCGKASGFSTVSLLGKDYTAVRNTVSVSMDYYNKNKMHKGLQH